VRANSVLAPRLDCLRNPANNADREFAHSAVFCRNHPVGDSAVERTPVRVYGMLLGALLAAAGMTTSVGAARANASTVTSVDIALVRPVGSYAGLTFRYIEGAVHGEVSAEEPIAGLRELAAGRTTIPYRVSFHIVAPAASEADAVVVEAPNRGRSIFPGAISVPAPVTGPSANPMANGVRRRRAPERARDRTSCRPRFRPLAWRRIPKRRRSSTALPPSHPGWCEPSRVVRERLHCRRLQRGS
jgi:hypothetical protein